MSAETLSPDQFGCFADGRVVRPDTAARLRVGSFGDEYDAAAAGRSPFRRRVSNAFPAHASRLAASGGRGLFTLGAQPPVRVQPDEDARSRFLRWRADGPNARDATSDHWTKDDWRS